jgi:hypothetical protein
MAVRTIELSPTAIVPTVDAGEADLTIKPREAWILGQTAEGEPQAKRRFIMASAPYGGLMAGLVFAVDLNQVGGANGDFETAPTWTYDVYPLGASISAEFRLAAAVDPSASPHSLVRSHGEALPATRGTAARKADGTLVLLWVNEAPGVELCPEE